VEILILHPGGLGDILLSLPAIRLLRSQFPSASFTIAANIDYLAPVAHGYAERVISLAALPLHRLYAPGALTDEEALFWKAYDRIVSWTGSGNSEFVRNLKRIHPDACIASWRPVCPQPETDSSRRMHCFLASWAGRTEACVPAVRRFAGYRDCFENDSAACLHTT
jgi:hypothetical protein